MRASSAWAVSVCWNHILQEAEIYEKAAYRTKNYCPDRLCDPSSLLSNG